MDSKFLTPYDVCTAISPNPFSKLLEIGAATSDLSFGCTSERNFVDVRTNIEVPVFSDLHQERLKIDRKKLEHMITGKSINIFEFGERKITVLSDNEAQESVVAFFNRIMEDTNTYISWPVKLKVGGKSRKDPHVKITGLPHNIQLAKQKILCLLSAKVNRITMKMDVSYTDHSNIIGKGGRNVRKIMEETDCHVHFPDSNRSASTAEKSNQVSITGDMQDVEKARSYIRRLIPLIFNFEVPIVPFYNIPNSNSPFIIALQSKFDVQVIFHQRIKLRTISISVKGPEWKSEQVKEATRILMEYICDTLTTDIPVQMIMQISPHNHSAVRGISNFNYNVIKQNTNTQIIFPDVEDPNVPSSRKSTVTIRGNIANVYAAKQQLTGSLPLVIMFDIPQNTVDPSLTVDKVLTIESALDVQITTRFKQKINSIACVIRGTEKYASNVYEARNILLGVTKPIVEVNIPPAYYVPEKKLKSNLISMNKKGSSSNLLSSPYFSQSTISGYSQQLPQRPNSLELLNNAAKTAWHQWTNYNLVETSDSSTSTSPVSCATVSPLQPGRSPQSQGSFYFNFPAETWSPQSDLTASGQGTDFIDATDHRSLIDDDQSLLAPITKIEHNPTNNGTVPNNIWYNLALNAVSSKALQSMDLIEVR